VDIINLGGPVSESHAIAYANAINLRPSDVHGLVGSTVALRRETKYGPLGSLGERCAGGVDAPGEVFGVLSQRFVRGQEHQSNFLPIESVFSAVYLLRSDAMASQEVSVFASARASSCLKRDNYDQVSTTGTKSEPLFTDVKIAPLSLPAGSVSAHGHRVTAVEAAFLEAPHVRGRPNYYEDFVGFSVGPAVITLHATGSTHPFPAATEQRLLSLLYRRAEASFGAAKAALSSRSAATKPLPKPHQSFRSLAVAKVVVCLHKAGVQIPASDSDLLSSTSGIKTRSPQVKAAIRRCRSEALTAASR
jgi:hypothetical protein